MTVGDKVKIVLLKEYNNNKIGTIEKVTQFIGLTSAKVVFKKGEYGIYNIKNLKKVKQ